VNQASKRSFRAILSVVFLDNLGLTVVYPIFTPLVLMPIYTLLPEHYSLSLRMILLGILIAVFPFGQFLAGPIIGHIADVKGRKFAFMLTLIGEAAGFFCTGLAIQFMSYPLLILGRIVSGVFAGNMTICLAAISDLSPNVQIRSRNFGIVSSVAGISFVTAIVIGGTLSNEALNGFFNSALPFWAITAFCFINIGVIRSRFTETSQSIKDPSHYFREQFFQILNIFKTSDLKFLYPLFFFFMLGWIITIQFLSSFLIEHFMGTKEMITIIFISIGIAWCIGTMWVNRLLLRFFTPHQILFVSLLLSTICLIMASEIQHILIFFHFIAIGGLFASLAWTNTLALISIRAPESLQGKLLGLNQSVATISMAFAPLFGGLIGEFDIHTIYLFASCSLSISLLILVVFNLKNIKN